MKQVKGKFMSRELKEIIRESGLKQYILASKIGITTNTLSCYMMGRRKPKYEIAVKMSKILAKYTGKEMKDIFFAIYNLNNDKQIIEVKQSEVKKPVGF